jgi:hypothetical protein
VVSVSPLGSLAEWITLHRRADAPDVRALLPEARPSLGRVPAPAGFGVPTAVVEELRATMPPVIIISATLTGLAALAAAATLRFVTRARSE